MANEKRLFDGKYKIIERLFNKRLIDGMDTVTKISKKVQPLLQNGCSAQELYDAVLEGIAEAPTVDAVEVVHAAWVCVNEDANVWMCTGKDGCGNELILLESTPKFNGWDYCPYCGAKMDGGNEDG